MTNLILDSRLGADTVSGNFRDRNTRALEFLEIQTPCTARVAEIQRFEDAGLWQAPLALSEEACPAHSTNPTNSRNSMNSINSINPMNSSNSTSPKNATNPINSTNSRNSSNS